MFGRESVIEIYVCAPHLSRATQADLSATIKDWYTTNVRARVRPTYDSCAMPINFADCRFTSRSCLSQITTVAGQTLSGSRKRKKWCAKNATNNIVIVLSPAPVVEFAECHEPCNSWITCSLAIWWYEKVRVVQRIVKKFRVFLLNSNYRIYVQHSYVNRLASKTVKQQVDYYTAYYRQSASGTDTQARSCEWVRHMCTTIFVLWTM